MNEAQPGVWATMLTPFTETGQIDYSGLERIVEWYLENRVAGLFAVCKSSESTEMSLDERLQLARFVVSRANGRVPVIAGGNLSATIAAQADEVARMADTGVDAVVLLSSRLVDEQESDAVWRERMEELVGAIDPGVILGVYESPSPYHRIVSEENLAWCRDTGRFRFLKDTSCDLELIRRKIDVVSGTTLRIFNANAQTLLESLRYGAAGYSSVLSSVTPVLCDWLVRNHRAHPERAERLQRYLSVADAAVVARSYPASAKYFLTLEGLPISTRTRMPIRFPVDQTMRRTIADLRALNREYLERYAD